MNQLNPFQAPQDLEVSQAAVDPARPKPWSVLSIISTLLIGGVVLGSLGLSVVNYRRDLGNMLDGDPDPSQAINVVLIMVQVVIVGFWMGVGSGHPAFRLVVSLFFMGVLYGEKSLFEKGEVADPIFVLAIPFLMVTAFASFLDTILLATSGKASLRALSAAVMQTIIPAVLVVGYFGVHAYAPDLIPTNRFIQPLRDLAGFATVGVAAATAGVFLLLRKHSFRRRWIALGIGLFVGMPVILGCLEAVVEGHWRNAVDLTPMMFVAEVLLLLAYHSTQRMLRSYGGCLVRVPRREELDAVVADEVPVIVNVEE